jgi:hypothetical protein
MRHHVYKDTTCGIEAAHRKKTRFLKVKREGKEREKVASSQYVLQSPELSPLLFTSVMSICLSIYPFSDLSLQLV